MQQPLPTSWSLLLHSPLRWTRHLKFWATTATLLLLLYAATSAGVALPVDRIAAALTALGWCRENRLPLSGSEIHALPAFDLLSNLTDPSIRAPVSATAAAMARAALSRPR